MFAFFTISTRSKKKKRKEDGIGERKISVLSAQQRYSPCLKLVKAAVQLLLCRFTAFDLPGVCPKINPSPPQLSTSTFHRPQLPVDTPAYLMHVNLKRCPSQKEK
ncbi:hypothetical protein ABW19_dt0201899 [Dactylella cylindrospora]|nr:hypothetical protein ABW19_dt0201899 [Dactylella cylindrospora]